MILRGDASASAVPNPAKRRYAGFDAAKAPTARRNLGITVRLPRPPVRCSMGRGGGGGGGPADQKLPRILLNVAGLAVV